MAFTPNGKHLVAGQWLDGNGTFTSSPAHGPAHAFAVGTVELVNRAAEAAEEAFLSYGYSSRATRAAFLRFAKEKGAMDMMVPSEVKVGTVPVLGSGKVDFVSAQKLLAEQARAEVAA